MEDSSSPSEDVNLLIENVEQLYSDINGCIDKIREE